MTADGSTPRRAWRARAEARGQALFTAFVQRSDDRRLERTIGSSRGLKTVFAGMRRAFEPEKAAGFTGDLQYDLLGMDGAVRQWTVSIGRGTCMPRPGPSPSPALVIKIGLADFARLAARDLDPGAALLTGRLDLEGDLSVAMRLGEMFGQPPAM